MTAAIWISMGDPGCGGGGETACLALSEGCGLVAAMCDRPAMFCKGMGLSCRAAEARVKARRACQ